MPTDVANDPNAQGAHTFQVIVVVAFAVANLACVAGLAWGSAALLRGQARGRVGVWAAGGCALAVQLSCGLAGLLANVTYRAWLDNMSADLNPGTQDFAQGLRDSSPLWLVNSAVIAGLLGTVLAVLAMLLLASTPLRRHFRTTRQVGTLPGQPSGIRR